MKMQNADFAAQSNSESEVHWAEIVKKQVGSLRFGVVQIIVHEKRVVQIERLEKIRLSPHIAINEALT
jgi:hypothetical protein